MLINWGHQNDNLYSCQTNPHCLPTTTTTRCDWVCKCCIGMGKFPSILYLLHTIYRYHLYTRIFIYTHSKLLPQLDVVVNDGREIDFLTLTKTSGTVFLYVYIYIYKLNWINSPTRTSNAGSQLSLQKIPLNPRAHAYLLQNWPMLRYA